MRDIPSLPPLGDPASRARSDAAIVPRRTRSAIEPADIPKLGAVDRTSVRSEPELRVLDYVRVLYKRRWTAIGVLFLVVSATLAYVMTSTPVFEAKTTLLIEADRPNFAAFRDVMDQGPTTDEYYQTQYKLLASRALAARTLDALKFWAHQEFSAASGDSGPRAMVVGALVAAASGVKGLFASSAPEQVPREPGASVDTSKAAISRQAIPAISSGSRDR